MKKTNIIYRSFLLIFFLCGYFETDAQHVFTKGDVITPGQKNDAGKSESRPASDNTKARDFLGDNKGDKNINDARETPDQRHKRQKREYVERRMLNRTTEERLQTLLIGENNQRAIFEKEFELAILERDRRQQENDMREEKIRKDKEAKEKEEKDKRDSYKESAGSHRSGG